MSLTNKIGFAVLLTTYIVAIYTFMTTFFSPTKSVMVTIDKYNEATIEYLFLLFTFPFVLIYTYKLERDITNEHIQT